MQENELQLVTEDLRGRVMSEVDDILKISNIPEEARERLICLKKIAWQCKEKIT